jgi:uncharacterized membrane protein YfcA
LTIALFVLTVAVGALVQSASGFGFGIFVMMFFPVILPSYGMSVTLSGALSLACTTVTAFRYRRHIAWKKLWLPSLCFCIVSAVFITLSGGAADSLMKRLLGAALILLSAYFLFLGSRIRIRPTHTAGAVAGSLSGLLSGLFSTGGPPIVVYLLAGTESNEEYLATIQAYFTVTNLFALAVRAANGLVTPVVAGYWVVGLLGIAAGVFLGCRVFHKLNAERLRLVVYLFMAISGLIMLILG